MNRLDWASSSLPNSLLDMLSNWKKKKKRENYTMINDGYLYKL